MNNKKVKIEQVAKDIYTLKNVEIFILYSLVSIIKIIKLERVRGAGHVTQMEEIRNMHMTLFGQDEIKRPLGRSWRNINKVNITVNLKKSGYDNVDCFNLALDRDQRRVHAITAMKLGLIESLRIS
jgi:hypothetical protein